MKILICGYGNIGQKTKEEIKDLTAQGHSIYIYDIKDNETYKNLNKTYDFCFVCVSTDMLPDGSCDVSNVFECIDRVNANIFVIKSTVPPKTCEWIEASYSDKKVVFSPEFYGTTIHAPTNLNFLILGGRNIISSIQQFFNYTFYT